MIYGSKNKPPIRFRALEKVRVLPPSLVQICLKRVAKNFLRYEALEKKIAKKQLEDVFAMLDLNMSLAEAAVRISDEAYWKRRTQANHRNAQVEKHGMSWKQTYLELDLQNVLQRLTLEASNQELEALRLQVHSSKNFVFQLAIGQFPSHMDLSFLFDTLCALCIFSITYGSRRLGMDYERASFGMKTADAQSLSRNVRVSQTLVSLSLPCNMIDDELVKVLMGGLAHGYMLTHLDLSHNKIGDRGARRLATMLDQDYCLQYLDLHDNQVHANGCMHLGAHLAENVSCQVLNLRLNRCEDNGVSHLFQDLCGNKYLKTLNIACNDLTVRSLSYLTTMMQENTTLTELDLSANPLYSQEEENRSVNEESEQEMGKMDSTHTSTVPRVSTTQETVAEGESLPGVHPNSPFVPFARSLMLSQALLRIDVRQCGLPAELAHKITNAVKHKELRAKGIPVEAYEKSKRNELLKGDGEAESGDDVHEVREHVDGESDKGDT
mmetsp:Transcript_29026/g.76562  ORF Transcript_29026/g.76562 Transcript_29026/m.76562 type:complete len:495 (-) Transcript_29026:61-1545(-)